MSFSWDAFLMRYGPMARALAKNLAHPSAAAEDVVQDAALALHRARASEPARFESAEHARNYFLRSVRNLAQKTHRGGERERPLEHEPPAADPEDPAARVVRERQHALARLLAELDPESRELVRRRFLQRETLARIASDTGVPLSTLHDRERAVLARLRKRMAVLDADVPDAATLDSGTFDHEAVG